jgi:hypothetical protein
MIISNQATQLYRAMFGLNRSKLKFSMLLFFLFIGLYGSYKIVIGLFGIDADTSHSLILWEGIRQNGVAWLTDWFFTQDNWLLSLFPFHFLGFAIFGATASVVIIGGWIIFVLSAILSGMIAWQLGVRKAPLLITVVLLNLGLYAHATGFVSYSTSHNISNLFGLFSIYILMKWVSSRLDRWLVILLIVLLCGAISDPWMLASYNLPILLVSFYFFLRPRKDLTRKNCLKIIAITIFSIFSVKSQLFGQLSFLPSMHFAPGAWSTVNDNAVYLLKDLGGLLNIIPFVGTNSFIPSVISLFILLFFLEFYALNYKNIIGKIRTPMVLYFIFAFFSVSGILSSFVISSVPAQDYSARFLINCIYLIPISIGVLAEFNWKTINSIFRHATILIVSLFLISNLASTFSLVLSSDFKFKETGVSDTIAFLKEKGLTYGYGPYWGANANAVTTASNFQVIVRPVVFDKQTGSMIVGNRAQTSKRWYGEQDIPKETKKYFVIVKSDGEECPDVDICLSGLVKQFGEPVDRYKRADYIILVWDHKLVGLEASPIKGNVNVRYFFSHGEQMLTGDAWSHAESWGAWARSKSAGIRFDFGTPIGKDVNLLIDGRAFLHKALNQLEVRILVNGEQVGTIRYDELSSSGVRQVQVPKRIIEKNGSKVDVSFSFDALFSPKQLGLSEDTRKIGFGLSSISFQTD